jgi:hypothetical protein
MINRLVSLGNVIIDIVAEVPALPERGGDVLASGVALEVDHVQIRPADAALVDLIVHHGGTGTVLSALEVGLPQLLLPQGADQFLNAEILAAAGAARALPNAAQQPGAIGEAVRERLSVKPRSGCAMRSPRCPHRQMWFRRWSRSRAGSCVRGRLRAQAARWSAWCADSSLSRARARGRSGLLRILHPESDFECDLEVLDLAVGQMPADVGDLEPVKASHRTSRALDPDADGIVNSLRGCADDLR